MMDKAILNFPEQFVWEPQIQNREKLKAAEKFVICGMGGSNLSGGIIRMFRPGLDILTHRDYGLPGLAEQKPGDRLFIIDSYSGNTEEAISSYEEAKRQGLNMVVISTGGQLLKLAEKNQTPYIQMPATGIQPRLALGLQIRALLAAMNEETLLQETGKLKVLLKPEEQRGKGRELAQRLTGFVPVIYASSDNLPLAYNWKIKFNETGKIPAFYNVFPELNHNEMTGFDVQEGSRKLSKKFCFLLLKDAQDHQRILRRVEILEKLYKDRGLKVEIIKQQEKDQLRRIFHSLLLADWAAFYTAEAYGLEPEQVPMVEEFKKLMKD